MNLSQLLQSSGIQAPLADDPDIIGITGDSREVKPGWLFVAVRGVQVDGHKFIPQALQAGAAAIVASEPCAESAPKPWVTVPDSRK